MASCGVNPIDFKTRSGLGFVSQTLGQRFHFVPGYDVSGVVDALSDGVGQWAPGDAVYGMVNFRCLPVPARNMWWRMRERASAAGPSLAHAGGLPLAGLTARQALFDVVAESGERFWCWQVQAVSAIFLFSLLHGKRQRERHRIAGQSTIFCVVTVPHWHWIIAIP